MRDSATATNRARKDRAVAERQRVSLKADVLGPIRLTFTLARVL